MKLCKVTGNVVATVKHPSYRGHKLMIVQPLDEHQRHAGASFLAVDLAQAGPGDIVLVMQEGNGVRQILQADQRHKDQKDQKDQKEQKLPIRSIIIGIVDEVSLS
jgi:microcompartment protein CcmK/EutM